MSKSKEDKIQVVIVMTTKNEEGKIEEKRISDVISKCSNYESFRSWKTNNRSKIQDAKGADIGPWIGQAAARFTALIGNEVLAAYGPGCKFSSPSSLMVFPINGTNYRIFIKSTTDEKGEHSGWITEKEEYIGDLPGVTTRSNTGVVLPEVNLGNLFD